MVAPTGSGKTLAAFLWSIDQLLAAKSPAGSPDGSSPGGTAAPGSSGDDDAAAAPDEDRTSVLYISPLKALGVDVERNLRAPLIGITQAVRAAGGEPPEISVGVRSGDTPRQSAAPCWPTRRTSSSPRPSPCTSCSRPRRGRPCAT